MSESIDESSDECSDTSGRVAPVVDRNRCEGKADCVRVCPYDVFEVSVITQIEKDQLSLMGKLKGWAHKWQQAHVINPSACHACNLCVTACPENALQLLPFEAK